MIEKATRARYGSFALSSALLVVLMVLLAAPPALAEPIQGDRATSLGAGYETTGDLLVFKNKKKGVFVAMRANDGTFEVQTLRQPRKARLQEGLQQRAVGVKANEEGDRLVYDTKTQLLTLDGQPLQMDNPSTTNLPNGGSIEANGNIYTITSEMGDRATLTVVGKFINLEVQAGPTRQGGDLKGSLGQFDSDADPTNDLAHPDSVQTASSTGWLTIIVVFLESWKILLPNSMFGFMFV